MLLILPPVLASCAGLKDSAPALPAVLLEQPVYFTNVDGSEITAGPGLYTIAQAGEARLRLIPASEKGSLTVAAMPMTFEEDLKSPVALAVPDNDSDYHVVLLVPGGTGLVASGSLHEVRQRSVGSVNLAKSKIKSALARHRARQQMKAQLATYPPLTNWKRRVAVSDRGGMDD